jgi:hypothetical protein
MDADQARWFLQVFVGGNKLSPPAIRELYLAGYLEIELNAPGKEPLPTVMTEKGRRVLQQQSGLFRSLTCLIASTDSDRTS